MKKFLKVFPFLLFVVVYSVLGNFRAPKAFADDFTLGSTNVTVTFKWKDRAHIELTTMKASSINQNDLTDSGKVLLQHGEAAFNADLAKNQKVYTANDMLSEPDKYTAKSACGGVASTEVLLIPGLTAKSGENQVDYPIQYIVSPSNGCNPVFNDLLNNKRINIDNQQGRDVWFTAAGDTLTRVDNNQTFKQDDPSNKLKFNGPTVHGCVQSVEIDKASLDAKDPLVKAKFRTCENEGDLDGIRISGIATDTSGNPTGTGNPNGSGTASPSCESNNGTIIIGWLVCGFLGILDNAVSKSTDVVDSLLDFDANDIEAGANANQLKTVWSMFRIISSVSLLAVALVMVIGQALGGE